jgi:hypothetical protein
LRLAAERAQITEHDEWNVRVNGQSCHLLDDVRIMPHSNVPLHAFPVPSAAMGRGATKVEVGNASASSARLIWLELAISDAAGKWPTPDVDLDGIRFDLTG